MTNSAAAFIEALHRRWRLTAHRARPPGEFPEGWKAWLGSMTRQADAVTGARAEEVLAVLMARPLPLPPERALLLTRWQAFSSLWRQQWHPAAVEERGLRWAALAFSLLVNLFFAMALVWLMYLQFLGLAPPPQGEDVVQVEFVGRGTPGEIGGGLAPMPPAAGGQDKAAPATAKALPDEAASASQPELPTSTFDAGMAPPEMAGRPLEVPEREVAVPTMTAAPQEQAVAVSEPAPDTTAVFVLPPPRSTPPTPVLRPRELRATSIDVQAREVAAPVRAVTRPLDAPLPAARALSAEAAPVMEREVAVPVRATSMRDIDVRTPAISELTARTPAVRERDVRAPRPAPSLADTAAPASVTNAATASPSKPLAESHAAATAVAASTTSPPSPTAAPSPTPASGDASSPARRPASASPGTSPGAGPQAAPAPGNWATPERADDWGATARNTPGAQRGQAPGVFNADGRVRVPEGPGSAAPGMPPGTVTQEIANLDRAGTWLKRKPTDFEPTAFDKYWVPNETLLAEWVRKSIKEVLIPIPGTNKRIRCAVALLALGGACAITDPNLNEQPASARPPPPVPFKPHLQEDNGSIKPAVPPGG